MNNQVIHCPVKIIIRWLIILFLTSSLSSSSSLSSPIIIMINVIFQAVNCMMMPEMSQSKNTVITKYLLWLFNLTAPANQYSLSCL